MGVERVQIARFARILAALCATAFLCGGCGDGEDVLGILPVVASSPGSRARDFLSASKYTNLVVEIRPFASMQPSQQTVDNLTQFLEERLHKPGGIRVVLDAELPASGRVESSLDEIRRIEAAARTQYPAGHTMAAFVLMLDTESTQSTGNARILGHAYGATSIVIYESAIQDLSGGIGEPSRDVLESTVIEHELGHILGLVDNGSPAVNPAHHDQGHGAHCSDQNCLMYYAVDLSDVVANLLGGSIPALDPDCLDDLRSNGGK